MSNLIIKFKLTKGDTSHDFLTMAAVQAFKSLYPEWADIEPVEYTEEVQPEVPAVPQEITLWQLRGAVTLAGLLTAVNDAIAALPEPKKTLATIVWEYGNSILRNSPTVLYLQQALQLTDQQADALFVVGKSLEL